MIEAVTRRQVHYCQAQIYCALFFCSFLYTHDEVVPSSKDNSVPGSPPQMRCLLPSGGCLTVTHTTSTPAICPVLGRLRSTPPSSDGAPHSCTQCAQPSHTEDAPSVIRGKSARRNLDTTNIGEEVRGQQGWEDKK